MATYVMCSVLDMVAQQYGRPFFTINEGSAIRGFTDEINNPESVLFRHPTDYQLFSLGSFDDESAQISQTGVPKLLISGSQCIQSADPLKA